MKNDRFYIVHQPIIDLANRDFIGDEALVRWKNSAGNLVPPDVFIPTAEEKGPIKGITRIIISKSLRNTHKLLRENSKFHLFINLSADDIRDGDFLQLLVYKTKRYGLNTQQIWLEVTEHGLIDFKAAKATIAQARQMGFIIAIDDFGTGYSGLSTVHKLPLDLLKLDKSFVDGIDDVQTKSVASRIIEMAHSLDLPVVAEGVETAAQADQLRQLCVKYAQGWLYSQALLHTALHKFFTAKKHQLCFTCGHGPTLKSQSRSGSTGNRRKYGNRPRPHDLSHCTKLTQKSRAETTENRRCKHPIRSNYLPCNKAIHVICAR